MVNRLASAALIAFGLTTSTVPASSREVQTFSAWGHTFVVPVLPSIPTDETTGSRADPTTGSIPVVGAYASIRAGAATANDPAADPHGRRTLAVWGARIDAPAY